MNLHQRCSASLVAVLSLVACGGGGGGASSTPSGTTGPIAVTFSPNKVQANFAQGDILNQVSVLTSLSRPPSGSVYVQVQVDNHVLAGDQVLIQDNGNGTYTGKLTPLCTLPPGTYNGAITLKLSSDSLGQSQIPITGNTLPYAFTVTPGMVISAKVDGVSQADIATKCSIPKFRINSLPHAIELTSNVPVNWSVMTVPYPSSSTLNVQNVVTTPTSFSATFSGPQGPVLGIYWGYIHVLASPTSGSGGASADFDITD